MVISIYLPSAPSCGGLATLPDSAAQFLYLVGRLTRSTSRTFFRAERCGFLP